MKKCSDTNRDVNLALLQIQLTQIEDGLLSPATILFNKPTRGLLPMINKTPMIYHYDDEH